MAGKTVANISLEDMAEKFREYSEFRIVYHIRPDGDCIGCAYALALALQAMGAKCDVVGQDAVPKLHHYMTDRVRMDAVENPVYISVDSAAPQRAGIYKDLPYTFCIDHHRDNSVVADYKYVEEDCGACAELIYKLISVMKVPFTKLMADLLYTGLVMDTMCFRTTDTSAQSFETAAALTRLGADVYFIGRRTMYIKTPQRMEIENRLRNSFQYFCDRKLILGTITLKDLEEADIADSELEGINSLVEQIMGLQIGVTVREQPGGICRCSVRTSGTVYANEICAVHGGGGHSHAACCDIKADPDTALKMMTETCMKFVQD